MTHDEGLYEIDILGGSMTWAIGRSSREGQEPWFAIRRFDLNGPNNHPLSLTQVRVNHAKSRIRARIEHVYGISRITRSHVGRSWDGDTNPFGS